MTIREFYACVGGDYEEVMSRLRSEERAARFLRMFPTDPSFESLSVVFPASEMMACGSSISKVPVSGTAPSAPLPSESSRSACPAAENEGQHPGEVSEDSLKIAFRAAHTLKGICLNLGLSRLYGSASAVTEALRAQDAALARSLMPDLRNDYGEVLEALRQLDWPLLASFRL